LLKTLADLISFGWHRHIEGERIAEIIDQPDVYPVLPGRFSGKLVAKKPPF
jgi:hypothetical protein